MYLPCPGCTSTSLGLHSGRTRDYHIHDGGATSTTITPARVDFCGGEYVGDVGGDFACVGTQIIKSSTSCYHNGSELTTIFSILLADKGLFASFATDDCKSESSGISNTSLLRS